MLSVVAWGGLPADQFRELVEIFFKHLGLLTQCACETCTTMRSCQTVLHRNPTSETSRFRMRDGLMNLDEFGRHILLTDVPWLSYPGDACCLVLYESNLVVVVTSCEVKPHMA